MIQQAAAALGLMMLGLSACTDLAQLGAEPPAYESTACGMNQIDSRGRSWFYPPGQRTLCLRVLAALTELEAQRRKGELNELAFLTRAVALLNGPDAIAVLAASTAPNGGWLGEHKHAYEQALEAAQRSATRT